MKDMNASCSLLFAHPIKSGEVRTLLYFWERNLFVYILKYKSTCIK